MEYPKYQSHKVVQAIKIVSIIPASEDADDERADTHLLCFGVEGEEQYPPHEVSETWLNTKDAKAGGYLVVYEDGYESFSPADVFEAGYTPITASAAEPTPGGEPFGEEQTEDGIGVDTGATHNHGA